MFLSRRNGTYYLWYQDQRGKRKKVSTRSRSKLEALRFLTSFSVSKGSNKEAIPRLSDFSTRVLQYVQADYARGAYLIYRDIVARLEKIIGDIPIDQITPCHFDLFKSKRLKEVSPKTANIALRNIKAVMGFGVRRKILNSNPFSRLSMARTPERAPVFFSKDKFQKFYDAIDREWFKEIVLYAHLEPGALREAVERLRIDTSPTA